MPATELQGKYAGRALSLQIFCAHAARKRQSAAGWFARLTIVSSARAIMLRASHLKLKRANGGRPAAPGTFAMANTHGWHFFMNPGPTNIPERILRAMDSHTVDFNSAQVKAISDECFAGLQRVFKTTHPILGYAATGHGAWEAALVNLFSPGDKVLVTESGYFSLNWGMRAEAFGLQVESLFKVWGRPPAPPRPEARLRGDKPPEPKPGLPVPTRTSTGLP